MTKFFPKLPFPGVTIRHLLTHTGGLPDYEDWITETATAEGTIPGNDIMIRFLCESGEGPEFAPGEKWEYSNTGYCVLAQIIEKVAGEPFETLLEKNIFKPAGMTATKVYHRRKDRITIRTSRGEWSGRKAVTFCPTIRKAKTTSFRWTA
ncbi:MAG: beta-lactamase family protein [Clostridia bacterium]|nr:beta-lactamase family protein [Clostridia bacterium]